MRTNELLEPRTLLHAGHGLHTLVNFQPAGFPTPAGFVADTGQAFGDRGNGLSYGWNIATPDSRARGSSLSQDSAYDTLNHMQRSGDRRWEISLPKGLYQVRIVAGDAAYTDSRYRIRAEGVMIADGTPTSSSRWVDGVRVVSVTDGRLTVTNAAGASNNKICLIDISQASSTNLASIVAIDAKAGENGGTAMFAIRRTGDLSASMTVNYAQTGDATPGEDYTGLTGIVTFAPGQTERLVTLTATDDNALEPGELLRLKLGPGEDYNIDLGKAYANAWIVDDESAAGGAYLGSPVVLSATIQAENFDFGGQGVGFREVDATPGKGDYRNGDADILPTNDEFGGFVVSQLTTGEWMNYQVTVPATGTYRIETRAAVPTGGGSFHLEFNGVNRTGGISLTGTGSATNFRNFTKTGVQLTAGTYTMRLVVDSASGGSLGNINWLRMYHDRSAEAKLNWRSVAAAPIKREEAQTAVVNGKTYVFGGLFAVLPTYRYAATSRTDMYDPATNKWTQRADVPDPITHAGTVVDGTKVWLVGGYVGDHPGRASSDVWVYDAVANTWARGPSLPEARGAGGCAIVGRRIYFFGGRDFDRGVDLTSHYMLDLNNLGAGWQNRAPVPAATNHLGSTALGGKIYAAGGQQDEEAAGVNTNLLFVYDPATDTWTRRADMPLPVSHQHNSLVSYNGKLIALGGELAHNVPANEVLAYDPATNRWSYVGSLPGVRRAGIAGVFGNQIIFSGGMEGGTQRDSTWVSTIAL